PTARSPERRQRKTSGPRPSPLRRSRCSIPRRASRPRRSARSAADGSADPRRPPCYASAMRSFAFSAAALLGFAFVACSDEPGATSSPDDAGTDSPSLPRDGGDIDPADLDGAATDANEPPLASANEKEPNNGAKETEIDTMAIPSVM